MSKWADIRIIQVETQAQCSEFYPASPANVFLSHVDDGKAAAKQSESGITMWDIFIAVVVNCSASIANEGLHPETELMAGNGQPKYGVG